MQHPTRGAALVATLAVIVTAGCAVGSSRVRIAGGPAVALPAPPAVLYGRAGSFGRFGSAVHAVDGWGLPPGQALYSAAVAADGSVILPAEPQTDDQTKPTSEVMSISVFDPRTDVEHTIVIPTSTGRLQATNAFGAQRGLVGGADVSAVVPVSGGVAFISAVSYHGWKLATDGRYPTFGLLSRAATGWAYDASTGRTADDLAASAPAYNPCRRLRNGFGESFADCRGPATMAVLPKSGYLVAGLYFGDGSSAGRNGAIVVLSPTGRIISAYAYPVMGGLSVHPRSIVADPTSADGRFAVVFDVFDAAGRQQPSPVQQFDLDPSTHAIIAVTAPTLSGDKSGSSPLGVELAQYDSRGNLWVAQAISGSLTGGDLLMYSGAPSLLIVPSLRIAAAAPLGLVRSLTEDPRTHTMLAATLSGALLVVGGNHTRVFDLGLDALVDRATSWVAPRGGAIDPKAGVLWLPIQQLRNPSTCAAYPCAPIALDQWLDRISLDAVES